MLQHSPDRGVSTVLLDPGLGLSKVCSLKAVASSTWTKSVRIRKRTALLQLYIFYLSHLQSAHHSGPPQHLCGYPANNWISSPPPTRVCVCAGSSQARKHQFPWGGVICGCELSLMCLETELGCLALNHRAISPGPELDFLRQNPLSG